MSQPTCAQCNTAGADLKRCGHCKYVFYCNKACQKAHWKQHKNPCSQARLIVIKCSNDPSITRAFPTFSEYLEECDRNGKEHFIPYECCTFSREPPDGHFVAVVDEDKHQEYQLRKANEKTASAAGSAEESLKDAVDGNEKIGFESIGWIRKA